MSGKCEVRLPETSPGIEESLVVFWHASVGDRVERGQALLEVQTEKAVFEIEAPAAGVVSDIVVPRGGVAKVGDVVAVLATETTEGLAGAALEEAQEAAGAPPAAEERAGSGGVQVAPRLRRLAKELGVDLARVEGTGAGGKITEDDVRRAADRAAVPAADPQSAGSVVPHTPIRRTIARRMMQSLQQSAQLTLTAWADVTELSEQRKRLAPGVTWNAWALRAAVLALREHPEINAAWEEDGIRRFEDVHLGVAVDTEDGLLVPVVREAHRLPLTELNAVVGQLAKKAREGRLSGAELSGGTFTVTNLGSLGVEFFTPVLNPPESAILGVGKLDKRLTLQDGQAAEQSRLPLSLTFDHRVVDGAPAAKFLQSVAHFLGQPERLL
ncbi:dihydrolipoamide acetyltransferase family protein [Paenibacillus sp.]|uniref:dihydrolipoamide acetyltransferase family protein n=1 Tax=Paenibacillus sp. TaxID=58172 RepID=UPI002D458398|nr:dihydrolipoamide acetyltransferase family protein [Paenibacillus sp.]HZG84574.1 dihydrolipoamide acetyltransferase family protein [Paenibacillus sp.]